MLKVNKKLITKGLGFALAGTLLFSTASCANGTFRLGEQEELEKYSYGYYMQDHCLENMLVVELENGKYKIIDDETLGSVYSDEKYDEGKKTELYEHLNADLLKIESVSRKDLINIEKYINGNKNIDFSSIPKLKADGNLIESGKVFYNNGTKLYTDANISEVEILFLDGKASRIVRRSEEKNTFTIGDEAIDIISGNIVHPSYSGISQTSTFGENRMKNLGYKEYTFIPLIDFFDELTKDVYTGMEVVELFYMIQGKTEEEIKEILNNTDDKVYVDDSKTKDNNVKTK